MKTSRFSFPRRVRIHGGECGAVARALHHAAQKVALVRKEQFKNSLISDEKAFLSQADLEKAFGSTFNERKQMSTKTTLKRIALVAVSALGFGLMSVLPAKADGATYLTGSSTGAGHGLWCSQSLEAAATGAATCTGQVGGQVTLNYDVLTTDADVRITVSNAVILDATGTAGSTVTKINGVTWADGVKFVQAAATDTVTLVLTASAEGASTITVRSIASGTGAATTVSTGTITWGSSASLAASAATSTVWVDTQTAAFPTAAWTSTNKINHIRTIDSQAALAYVQVKDSFGNALSGVSVTATVSGPGMLGIKNTDGSTVGDLSYTNATVKGRAVSLTAAQMGTNKFVVSLVGDGTAGTSTVTISRGTVTLGTFTATFYSSTIAKIEATTNYAAVKTASAETDHIELYVTDSGGNPIENATLVVTPDTVVTGTSVTGWTCGTFLSGLTEGVSEALYPGYYNCYASSFGSSASTGLPVYGVSKVKFANSTVPALVTATSNEVSLLVSRASITTLTATLDKATYAPGEAATLTFTAKDADGNSIAEDGTYSAIFDSYLSNKSVPTTIPAGLSTSSSSNSKGLSNGVQAFTMYAPTTPGDWILTFKTPALGATGLAAAMRGKEIVVKATVGNDAASAAAEAAADAAAEAIDAANAATDAANLAAEAADAATVAAEEARDAADAATAAVEELSTQVATLMAALRAQITTLANTVAKIAKKVRA